jgi:hypothetical protein
MLHRLARWSSEGADPWDRLSLPFEVPLRTFGRGSYRPFPWYFEGESVVQVTSINDICDWLIECEYTRDPALFNAPDFWQHPRTFEQLREGDCEDHAIWAWRKLVELGFEAELMCGAWQPPDDTGRGHAWVRFRKENQEFVFEAVGTSREQMVRPLADAKAEYIPHAGVDHKFQRFAYVGYFRSRGRYEGA